MKSEKRAKNWSALWIAQIQYELLIEKINSLWKDWCQQKTLQQTLKTKVKKMPGNGGVHYGLRGFSTDSLIEEIKPGTGDSCALCLDPIREEAGNKVKKLLFKTGKILAKAQKLFQPGDLKGENSVEQSEERSHKIRSSE